MKYKYINKVNTNYRQIEIDRWGGYLEDRKRGKRKRRKKKGNGREELLSDVGRDGGSDLGSIFRFLICFDFCLFLLIFL